MVQNHLVPQEFVAVNDSFGESGTPDQLMEKYKLNNQAIVEAVEKVIKESNILLIHIEILKQLGIFC